MISPIEIMLSFFEGLALIVSPCILPILPLILSTSIEGGRKRPFGIIIGFVLAFTFFALLSRELVAIFHVNLEYLKIGALTFLALFGIVLLSETLMNRFARVTQSFANTGTSLSAYAGNGFFSGIWIGVLIGLVWTPCAGPILAVALVQVIRAQENLNAVLLIIAFAMGAGLPMLFISFLGRKFMTKLRLLSAHEGVVHKILGILILGSVVFIASGVNASSFFSSSKSIQSVSSYPAPQFATSDIWLNTPDNKPLTMASLKGKVVLVDFWTYSCVNCIRTLPYLNEWYKKYHDKGLVIVGVHAPEFEFEKNRENVIQAITRYNIQYPVAMDNNLDTWTNFNNQYWPAHYLIDKDNQVVYTHFGEGHYQETENKIRQLLGLDVNVSDKADSINFYQNQTPETYLGSERTQNFSSPEGVVANVSQSYSLPSFLPANHWALSGRWLIDGKKITSQQGDAKLELNFTAKHVYLVLGNATGAPISIILKLNGNAIKTSSAKDAPNGIVNVQGYRLYELVNQAESQNSLLEIDVTQPGLEAYAFTFG